MMLTWKIFVTIMSMVPLTLQMKTSGAGSSSRPIRIFFYDKESERHYPIIYNKFNYFSHDTVAHKCFAKIKLFCQPIVDNASSEECAKKGILFYRTLPNRPLDDADRFFHKFPLDPGNFELPAAFCRYKGEECIKALQDYDDLVQAPRREDIVVSDNKDDLQQYIDLFQALQLEDIAVSDNRDDLQQYMASVIEETVKTAEKKSHMEIAKFALIHKDIFKLNEENVERKYLEHISEHVSSIDSMNQNIIYYDK